MADRPTWKDFRNRRLWVTGSDESTAPGGFRRLRGVARTAESSLRSRHGSTKLHSTTSVHSITRWQAAVYYAASTVFYRNGVSIYTGLNGNRLTLAPMAPTIGAADHLFVAGGNDLFKSDSTGATSDWGITAPVYDIVVGPTGLQPVYGAASYISDPTTPPTLDIFNTAANWTPTSATVTTEATIVRVGNSVKMGVAANTLGSAVTAAFATAFDANDPIKVGTHISSCADEDEIQCWVQVDNPENLEYLQLDFDVDNGDFSDHVFSHRVLVSDLEIPQDQVRKQTFGVYELEDIQKRDEELARQRDRQSKRRWSKPGLGVGVWDGEDRSYKFKGQKNRTNVSSSLAQLDVPAKAGVWTLLRIPKIVFSLSGDGTKGWDTISAIRIIAKTNSKGAVNVYWDELYIEGMPNSGFSNIGVGDYTYRYTYRNSTTGTRSNPNPSDLSITLDRRGVGYFFNISTSVHSADPQVDKVEFWRTLGNGTLLFKAFEEANSNFLITYPFYDVIPDLLMMDSRAITELSTEELLFNNIKPADTYNRCAGPWQATMWWCGDSATGAAGHLYYSPVGRAEAVDEYLVVTHDGDATQIPVVWNDALWVFTEKRIFRVVGTGPYSVREITGCPGTTAPFTVAASAAGIFYQAKDGVRLFNGTTSQLAGFDGVGVIFRGEARENLTAFEGVVACATNDEYIISDGTQTLGLAFDGKWRDLGVGCTALHYSENDGKVYAALSDGVYNLEDEGVLLDGTSTISFDIEPNHVKGPAGKESLLTRVYVDMDTNGETISPTLLVDDVEYALADFITSGRDVTEWATLKTGEKFGLRLSGSLSKRVELHEISMQFA